MAAALLHARPPALLRSAPDKRARHGELTLHAILVDAHVTKFIGTGHPVPDEVVPTPAGPEIVVKPVDRITQHLLVLQKIEGEKWINRSPCFWVKIGLIGRAPPNVVAGINGLQLWGQQRWHA